MVYKFIFFSIMRKIITSKILNIIIGLFLLNTLTAQIIYTPNDSLIFENYITEFTDYTDTSDNDLLVLTAKHFLEKPYVASTLDKSDKEQLTVNLREFDCTTFVESCLALTETIKSKDLSFNNYCKILQNIRYRNGKINDYASRLHYVSDWINENEGHNRLKNMSKELGGTLQTAPVNFMSRHVSLYPQLSKSNKLQEDIKKVEHSLNKKGGYYVISKGKVRDVEKLLKSGDIVVFSTSIDGLDFSHIGIIYINNQQLTFIHASSAAGKVIIEKKSLHDYCLASKRCNGITIVRLISDNYE